MEKVLIYLKKGNTINIDVLDSRRKELVCLGNAILSGDKFFIEEQIKKALEAGASRKDILKMIEFIIGDKQLFKSLIKLFDILDYEENKQAPYISILNDVREE
jgi:hypothetical protein